MRKLSATGFLPTMQEAASCWPASKHPALYVSQGSVDAAIIGRADAFQNQDRIRMVPIPKAYFHAEVIAGFLIMTGFLVLLLRWVSASSVDTPDRVKMES